MATNIENYQKVIEAAQHLSPEQRQQLIEELTRRMEEDVIALSLSGTWQGVSLSEEEIDEARRECWVSLGEDE